ncbi:hypothetical protein [Gulosibacter molinativorax]|nr:hypothetical protein [Gulosibacter molinativorax]
MEELNGRDRRSAADTGGEAVVVIVNGIIAFQRKRDRRSAVYRWGQ